MFNFINSRSSNQFVIWRFFIANFNSIHIIQSFLFILKRFSCLILHGFLVILPVIIPSFYSSSLHFLIIFANLLLLATKYYLYFVNS